VWQKKPSSGYLIDDNTAEKYTKRPKFCRNKTFHIAASNHIQCGSGSSPNYGHYNWTLPNSHFMFSNNDGQATYDPHDWYAQVGICADSFVTTGTYTIILDVTPPDGLNQS